MIYRTPPWLKDQSGFLVETGLKRDFLSSELWSAACALMGSRSAFYHNHTFVFKATVRFPKDLEHSPVLLNNDKITLHPSLSSFPLCIQIHVCLLYQLKIYLTKYLFLPSVGNWQDKDTYFFAVTHNYFSQSKRYICTQL